MRLIDADVLKYVKFHGVTDWIPIEETSYQRGWNGAINAIMRNAPTVDAVEVVRCKDCRWGKETCGNIECSADLNLPSEYHGHEWFCPNGERRKDEVG